VILTGEEDEKALSQIPKNAKVVYHDSAELKQSLKIARESGNFEVLNAEVPHNNEVWLFKFSNNLWTRVH